MIRTRGQRARAHPLSRGWPVHGHHLAEDGVIGTPDGDETPCGPDATDRTVSLFDDHVRNDEVRAFLERSRFVVLSHHERGWSTNGFSRVSPAAISTENPDIVPETAEISSPADSHGSESVVLSRDRNRFSSDIFRALSDDEPRAETTRNNRSATELSWGTNGRRHVGIDEKCWHEGPQLSNPFKRGGASV